MKKLLLIILTAAGFALANTEQTPQDDNSGLYFAAGIGFTRSGVSHLAILSDTDGHSGIGPYADLRLGWTLSKKFSVHGTVNGSIMNITYYHSNDGLFGDHSSYSSSGPFYHLFVGGGATFYPFKNPASKMNGAHIGLSLGYLTYHTIDPKDSTGFEVNGNGMGMILELGKTWKIGDHWGIGFGETNTIGLFGKETTDSFLHSSEGGFLGLMSFGLQFKVTRR